MVPPIGIEIYEKFFPYLCKLCSNFYFFKTLIVLKMEYHKLVFSLMIYLVSNCRTQSIHYKLERTIQVANCRPPFGGLCHVEWW